VIVHDNFASGSVLADSWCVC